MTNIVMPVNSQTIMMNIGIIENSHIEPGGKIIFSSDTLISAVPQS